MKKGFTLIELLISITILAILMVVIFGSLRIGSRAWEKGERDIERYQRLRMISEILYREIGSTFPYETTESETDTHRKFYLFVGESSSIKFVTTIPLKRKAGLSLLELRAEGERGLLIKERDALKADLSKDDFTEDPEESVLDDQVTSMTFQYYDREEGEDEGEWLDSWDAKEMGVLPKAVKVKISFKDGREGDMRELIVPVIASGKDLGV